MAKGAAPLSPGRTRDGADDRPAWAASTAAGGQFEGWWTSLQEAPLQVIDRYTTHGTHEQFHSEIQTDLDLERLPCGKADCRYVILPLGIFGYNSLRLIGQLGFTGELAPVRHPARRARAKRRRIKTVLQELLYRAAQYLRQARQRTLDFGRNCSVVAVFRTLQEELLTAGRSP